MDKKSSKYISMFGFAVLGIGYIIRIIDVPYWSNIIPFIGVVMIIASLAVSKPILTSVGSCLLMIQSLSAIKDYAELIIKKGYDFFISSLILEIIGLFAFVALALVFINKKLVKTTSLIAGIIKVIDCIFNIAMRYFSIGMVINTIAFVIGAVFLGYAFGEEEKVNRVALEKSDCTKKSVLEDSNIDKLIKLSELLEAGIITKEEFEEKKKQLLNM